MDGKMKLLAVLAVAMMAFAAFAVVSESDQSVAEIADTDVAKIGDTGYATLELAIAAAEEGNTIELLKDISSATQFVIDKALTLNGAGKKITSTAAGNAAILVSASNVTINNLTVNGPNTKTGWDDGEYGIKVFGGAINGIVLDGVTVTNANAGILINGNVTLKGTITVSGNEYGGIEVSKSSTDETVVGKLKFDSGASIVCTDTAVPAMWIDKFGADYNSILSNAVEDKPSSMKVAMPASKDQCFIVTGSYALGAFEATLEGIYYETLTQAISKASTGNIVALQKSIEPAFQIIVDKAITIDGNSKTIKSTATGNAAILVSSSTVTIKNLTVEGPNTKSTGWDGGEYGIKVFGSSINGIVLENVTVTKANAGILINGNVTLKGTISVSGNEYGGIEVSKSSTEQNVIGKLTFNSGSSIVCTDKTVPAIWIDNFEADFSGKIENAVVGIPSAMKYAMPASKDQCFIVTDSYDLSSYEAAIGTTYYGLLDDALEAATVGQTISLKKSCTYSGTGALTAAENVTISGAEILKITTGSVNLNNGTSFVNVTFQAAGSGNLFDITAGKKDISFKNCIFTGDSTEGAMNYINASGYVGNMTVDGCMFVNTGDNISRDVVVTISDSATATNTKVTVKNCSMSIGSGTDISTPVRVVTNTPSYCVMSNNTMSGSPLIEAYDNGAVVLIAEASCDAKIGDLYYRSVEEAITKATSSQTLDVVKNCSVTKDLTVYCYLKVAQGKILTIDGTSPVISLTFAKGSSLDGTVAYMYGGSANSATFENVVAGNNGFVITKGSLKITGMIDSSLGAVITAAGSVDMGATLSQTGTTGGLTIKKSGSGSVTIDGMTVNEGATLNLATDAAVKTGSTMTIKGKVEVESGTTLTNNGTIAGSGTIENNGSIKGNTPGVEVIDPVKPGNYRVKVTTNGSYGTATSNPVNEATPGTTVKLTYEVKTEGYGLKEWKGPEGLTIKSDGTFVMPSYDVTITAVFEKQYKVDIAIEGVDKTKATVSATPNPACKDAKITLSYTTSSGVYFKEWKAPEGVTITGNTFTMPEKDVTVTAVFGVYENIVKTVSNGSVKIPWALANTMGIKDASELTLKIDKIDSPSQPNIPKDAIAYSITLSKGTTALTSFADKIEVTINYTTPSGSTGYDVYYVSEDGKTVEKMNATYTSGKFTFSTKHLSTYAISSKEIQPATDGPNWTLIAIVIVAGLIIIAVIVFFLKRNNGGKPKANEYFDEGLEQY